MNSGPVVFTGAAVGFWVALLLLARWIIGPTPEPEPHPTNIVRQDSNTHTMIRDPQPAAKPSDSPSPHARRPTDTQPMPVHRVSHQISVAQLEDRLQRSIPATPDRHAPAKTLPAHQHTARSRRSETDPERESP